MDLAKDTNKLENFKNAVFADIDNKADKKIREAQKAADKMRKAAENTVKYNEQEALLRIDKDAQARIVRELSSKQLDSKRNVLLHRKQLVSKVFDNVSKKLEDFKNSEKYEEYLKASIKSCKEQFPDEKGIVYVGKADEKYKDTLAKLSGFEVEIRPTVLLGGLIVSYPEINVMLDHTFDSALEQEREDFCNVSELAL